MNLTTQKRLAAEVLKVGINKIWIDPAKTEDVSRAITRDDIRHFISNGAIIAEPDKGNSRGRFKKEQIQKKKGRRKGHGHRAGHKGARTPKKEKWVNKVRALRAELRDMKKEKSIKTNYRKVYRQIKGNLYHSRRHLRENVGTKK